MTCRSGALAAITTVKFVRAPPLARSIVIAPGAALLQGAVVGVREIDCHRRADLT